MAEAKSKATLEERFEKIENMIEQLEDSDTTLEASFKLYQDGMKLLKQCNEDIDRVEKKVLQLNAESGLVPFEEDEEEDDEL